MERMELTIIIAIMLAVAVIALVFVALYPDGPPAGHGAPEGGTHDDDIPGEAVDDAHATEGVTDAIEPATDDHVPAETH